MPMVLDDASPSVAVTAVPGTAQLAVPSASADAIVGRLFDISMTLASCAQTADKHAATRVLEAIDGLDHVIVDLRTAIFDGFGNPEPVAMPPRQNGH